MKKLLILITSLVLGLTFPLVSLADWISNTIDTSVDAVAEVMPLTIGGAPGTTQFYIDDQHRNGDGVQGCNLINGKILTVSVNNSNPSVAVVNPSTLTFNSCVDSSHGLPVTVIPMSIGSTTITLTQITNNTGGSFNFEAAKFTVNVTTPQSNQAPVITINGVNGGANYEKGSVPTAMCHVTDAEDGILNFPATLSSISGPLAQFGLGSQTAYCSYTDKGGLTASASVAYNIVDTTVPVINLISRTPANGNGWNNTDVTLVWSCTDSGSGVVSPTVSTTLSTEGENQSATGTCADRAGNTASNTQSGINIDKTAPSITGESMPVANTNGWNNTDVTVNFTCSDSLSDIATCQPSMTVNTEGANQSVTGTAEDKAGNVANTTISGINIDKTSPVISFTDRTPANGNGWNNTDVTINWGCSDTLSGPESKTTSQTLGSEGKNQSATGTCTDLAGNTASDTQNGIYIDKTAPILSPSVSPNPVVLNGNATATPNAIDTLSGVDSQNCDPVNTSRIGKYSVTCNATDKAGNSETGKADYSVIYRWDGFLQPINDTAHQTGLDTSVFKGGSTVPAKFQLKDANGNIVQAGIAPTWITPVKGSQTSAVIDESAYSDSVTPGSTYRWDATSQQYIYNWSTKGSATGYYYKVGVKLDDGQTYTVNLGLR